MSRRNRPQGTSQSRRDFLFKSACAALTTVGITNTIRDLRLINAAAAATLPRINSHRAAGASSAGQVLSPPYRALICIFMFGGNDSNNLLIPTDTTTYNQYSAARTSGSNSIALPMGNIIPITPNKSDGHTYGLHGSCTNLANLFGSGQLAIQANVGTLLAPLTQAQYKSKSVAVPPQLFSHNDQQLEWQTSVEDQPPASGWGGRSADLLYNPSSSVSMNISLAGSNVFETGSTVNAYNVSTSGAISLSSGSTAQTNALKNIIGLNHPNLYEGAFGSEMTTSINDALLLNNAIAPTKETSQGGTWKWNTPFPTTPSSLGSQLKMIARLIAAAPALGHSRQVFFASIGGFDLHGAEGANSGAHANILQDLDRCMNALYQATAQLDTANLGYAVSPNVTQFTSSDFNRTFPMNTGAGTDHGWGSHHLVLGGGVNGKQIYGTFPTLQVGGPDDTSTGRWIPTTSVDQYAATLAKWFGVLPGNMSTVFPYLGRFATPDLGFMAP